jgi:hypothetical protein
VDTDAVDIFRPADLQGILRYVTEEVAG